MARTSFLVRVAVAFIFAAPAFAQEAPEAATARQEKSLVRAQKYMVVAANPLAAQAGLEMLRAGGSAIDAAIATSLALNVVEPQSSGIGGGAFLVHYDAKAGQLAAYDGRETAPATAKPERFIGADGRPLRYLQAVGSGLSVGVPGLLRLHELVHARHGRLPWARLFAPAIRLAEDGFIVSPRLAELVARDPLLKGHPSTRALFFHGDGTPLRAGERFRNPALAATLKTIASEGADAFYRGAIGRDIVAAVTGHPTPGDLAPGDLTAYRALERAPLGRERQLQPLLQCDVHGFVSGAFGGCTEAKPKWVPHHQGGPLTRGLRLVARVTRDVRAARRGCRARSRLSQGVEKAAGPALGPSHGSRLSGRESFARRRTGRKACSRSLLKIGRAHV